MGNWAESFAGTICDPDTGGPNLDAAERLGGLGRGAGLMVRTRFGARYD